MHKTALFTPYDVSPNSFLLFSPLLKAKSYLRNLQIDLKIIHSIPSSVYDTIIVDSKIFRPYWGSASYPEAVLATLSKFRKLTQRLVYFDTTDSTGSVDTDVIPYVDQYWKPQLLAKPSLYTHNIYASRLFLHSILPKPHPYHEHNFSALDSLSLSKLKVAWNISFGSFFPLSSRINHLLFQMHIPYSLDSINVDALLSLILTKRSTLKTRFTNSHSNPAICLHRQQAAHILSNYCNTTPIPKLRYYIENLCGGITFSPFGWGEICYRDLESFYARTLLIKPSMEHLSTWPEIYLPYHTYIPCAWRLQDLDKTISWTFENLSKSEEIADRAHHLLRNLKSRSTSLLATRLSNLLN